MVTYPVSEWPEGPMLGGDAALCIEVFPTIELCRLSVCRQIHNCGLWYCSSCRRTYIGCIGSVSFAQYCESWTRCFCLGCTLVSNMNAEVLMAGNNGCALRTHMGPWKAHRVAMSASAAVWAVLLGL